MKTDMVSVTLTELSLVLLFLLLILFYADAAVFERQSDDELHVSRSQFQERIEAIQQILDHRDRELELSRDEQMRHRADLAAAQKEVAEKEKTLAAVQTELNKLESQVKLRSKQRPSCIEVGAAEGFLDTVTILSPRAFGSVTKEVLFTDLTRHYRAALRDAERHDCVQSIRVRHGAGISLDIYLTALRRLEQRFYVQRIDQN